MGSQPIILSIAGYDPTSGAGVTADVKTAAAVGCYAVTCITALTVQSTQGVFGMEPVRPEMVRQTLLRLADDVEIAAVRIGMLGSGGVAEAVAEYLQQFRPPNVVLDPVLRSSSGSPLVDASGIATIRNRLLPLCDVVTPNVVEAAELAGGTEEDKELGSGRWESAIPRLRELAARFHELGCRCVVVTGGHLQHPDDYLSLLESGQIRAQVFAGERVESKATHGTGCAFATALACGLARGRSLPESVQQAKDFVRLAITAAYPVGKGTGPMNHLYRIDR